MAAPATGKSDNLPTDPVERLGAIVDLDDDGGEVGAANEPRAPDGKFSQRPAGPQKPAKAAAPAADDADDDLDQEFDETGSALVPADDDDAPAPAGDQDDAGEEGDEGEGGDAGEDRLLTLTELSETLNIDPDAFAQNISVEVVDGDPVPLSTVLADYANMPDATALAEEYDARRQELDDQYGTIREGLDQELQRATNLVQILLTELKQDEPDWTRLRQDLDPDDYLSRREAWMQRDAMIRNSLDQLQDHAKAQDEQVATMMKARATEEASRLQRAMPSWRKKEVAQAAQAEMREYLGKVRGFTAEEVNSILDHRMVLVIHDAVLGNKTRSSKPEALKRIAAAKGKVKFRPSVGSGARSSDAGVGRTAAAKRRRAARARLSKSGRIEDAAAALEGLIE